VFVLLRIEVRHPENSIPGRTEKTSCAAVPAQRIDQSDGGGVPPPAMGSALNGCYDTPTEADESTPAAWMAGPRLARRDCRNRLSTAARAQRIRGAAVSGCPP
jgi:hypothetical protein